MRVGRSCWHVVEWWLLLLVGREHLTYWSDQNYGHPSFLLPVTDGGQARRGRGRSRSQWQATQHHPPGNCSTQPSQPQYIIRQQQEFIYPSHTVKFHSMQIKFNSSRASQSRASTTSFRILKSNFYWPCSTLETHFHPEWSHCSGNGSETPLVTSLMIM